MEPISVIQKKDILVVGASRGLGAAIAQIYLAAGNRVFGIARSETAKIAHPDFIYKSIDIRIPDAGTAIVNWLEQHKFQYDYIFLNSGAGHAGFAQNTPFEAIEDVFQTNFFGLVRAFCAILDRLQELNKGVVVVVSSLAAYRGLPGSGPYCATKAALTSLFEAYKIDLQGTQIKIIQAFPYFVITELSNPNAKPSRLLWMSADNAAKKIVKAVEQGKTSISFPIFFHVIAKIWQILPRSLYYEFWRVLKRGG